MNAARNSADGKRRARLAREHAAGAHRTVALAACPTCAADPHPTFQQLRDGDRYRTSDGRIVKLIAPFIPGRPILTRVVATPSEGMAEGNYFCSTRQLWRIEP